MPPPRKHDELGASRGILVSVALGLLFWSILIMGIVLLVRHLAQ